MNNASGEPEGTELIVDGNSEEHKALGEFDIDVPRLEGKGKMGG